MDEYYKQDIDSDKRNKELAEQLDFQVEVLAPQELDIIEEMINRKSNGELNILEMGCGNGLFAVELAKICSNAKIMGIDNNHYLISKAKERESSNLKFKVQDFIKGDPSSLIRGADVVVFRYVLQHVREFRNILKKLQVNLKPGALVISIEGIYKMPSKDDLSPFSEYIRYLYRFYEYMKSDIEVNAKIKEELIELKFKDIEVKETLHNLNNISANKFADLLCSVCVFFDKYCPGLIRKGFTGDLREYVMAKNRPSDVTLSTGVVCGGK